MKNIIIDFVTNSVVYREQGNYAEKGGEDDRRPNGSEN